LAQVIDAEVALPLPPSTRDAVKTRIWVERSTLDSRLKKEAPLFVLTAAVVALSFLLPILQAHHAWINVPCIFHSLTGVPCLACGLTRSYVFTAHGNFASAFNMHLLGPLMFFATCGVAAYLATSVVSGYRIRYTLSKHWRRMAFWSVLGLFLVCWGIKLVFMKGSW
jgi:Protein of unknown function (DUF2752)